MTYYRRRRSEILGPRKRKPRARPSPVGRGGARQHAFELEEGERIAAEESEAGKGFWSRFKKACGWE